MLIAGPVLFWALALSRIVLPTMTGCAADEDRGAGVGAAAVAVGGAAAAVVELQQAVGDAHVGLMDFDGVEAVEVAFDRHRAAGIEHAHAVEAGAGSVAPKIKPPQSPGAGPMRRASRLVSNVPPPPYLSSLSEVKMIGFSSVPSAMNWLLIGRFDPRAVELDDHAGIDPQPAVGERRCRPVSRRRCWSRRACPRSSRFSEMTWTMSVSSQRVVQIDEVERVAGQRADADEQAVDRVVRLRRPGGEWAAE